MPADRALLPPTVAGSVVTVGTFDGVHLGHRHVLSRLTQRARERRLASVLVTFEPHPLEIVRPEAAPLRLTLPEERSEELAATGLDYVVVVRFTPDVARLSAEEFVDQMLRGRLGMRELMIGHDHGFGRGREGDFHTLQALGADRGFAVNVLEAVAGSSGEHVSSSAIRAAVARGDLDTAADGLGRRYAVSGRVAPGAKRGRAMGFPTINVVPPPRKQLPALGVYAVRVATPAGTFGGMLNFGARPTFDVREVALEAHLFDTQAELYGAPVRLEFVARLRDVRRFESPDALKAQLATDERAARDALRALTQTL